MSVYRVKQFFWYVFARVEDSDLNFINRYLNEEEKRLFDMLSSHEQKHSIKVAQDVEKHCSMRGSGNIGIENSLSSNANSCMREDQLIKAALLHDIGKSSCKLNVFEKSILVMLHSITKGSIKKYKKFKKINVYYNHGDLGYEILKKYDYDKRFLYLIKNHHNKDIKGDNELDILIQCDSNH